MRVKQTHKYLQMWLIHLMHQNTKGPIEIEHKVQKYDTAGAHGISIVEA